MIYAIGDIHGSLDLLEKLLLSISEDAAGRNLTRPRVVILGDFIDRGPHSKNVIDLFLSKDFNEAFEVTILLGNHEEWLLRIIAGESDLLSGWLHNGGAETIESYGVEFGSGSMNDVYKRFIKVMPLTHVDFLKSRPLTLRCENWFFVHAGVMPGIPLEHQHRNNLLWIGNKFTSYEGDFGSIIVHGHTVTKSRDVEVYCNRIAVDTGAGYKNRPLSAAVLENGSLVKTLSSDHS